MCGGDMSPYSAIGIARNLCWTIEAPRSRREECMGRDVPFPSRLGGLEERRKFPSRGPGRSPGRKRVLAVFKAWKKTHLIATNLSYLTFLWHTFIHFTFTITKHKTFSYIFVPFAQLKRTLCNFFHSLWGPKLPGPCTRLCTHMYSFLYTTMYIYAVFGAKPQPPNVFLDIIGAYVSAGWGKVAVIFSITRPKSGGTVPPLQKVGGTRTPRTPCKLRLWLSLLWEYV